MKNKMKTMVTVMAAVLCMTATPMRVEAAITAESSKAVAPGESKEATIQVIYTEFADSCVVTPYYVVTAEGETIETISEKFGMATEAVMAVNSEYKTPEEAFAIGAYVELPEIPENEEVDEYFYHLGSFCDVLQLMLWGSK